MFLRFSKSKFDKDVKYRKCVFLGDSVVMEYENKIVGIAKLHEETNKTIHYDIVVAKECELGGKQIARYIKDMIGRSNKFTTNPSTKRRRYHVKEVDCNVLPVEARIVFSVSLIQKQ